MHIVRSLKAPPGIIRVSPPQSEALMLQRLLTDLPSALKTPNNIELLKTYFLIPHHSIRCFVLVLYARITGDTATIHPIGDRMEAEYLLAQNAQLPTSEVRDKMLTLVRQICTANRGIISDWDEDG